MARNGSGTYTVPNSFTAGTTITAADHNENWSDVASEVTNSVAADGQTSMTGPLKASSGTAAAPAHTFAADTDTGGYRSAANEYSVAAGGMQIAAFSSAGIDIKLGSLKFNGTTLTYPLVAADLASNSVTTAKITDANVTLAKLADLATQRLIGRNTGSTGVPEAVTAQQLLNWVPSSARGDILVRGASDWDRLAKGTAGYVLTSDGTDTAWAQPVIKKLSTQTASASASLAFTSLIDSTYRRYIFEIDNLLPASDDVQLLCEVSVDAGSNWKTTTYIAGVTTHDTSAVSVASSTTAIVLSQAAGGTVGVDNGAGYGWNGAVELVTPSNSGTRKTVLVRNGSYLRGGGSAIQTGVAGSGFWNGGNDAITGIRFRYSSGNIASGAITMLGVV